MEIRTDFKILFALILITVFSFFYYQNYINKNDSKIKNLDDLLSQLEHNRSHAQLLATLKASKLKSIQLLTSYYGWGDWYHFGGLGRKPFENCTKERRCYAFRLPNNMGQKALEQSDGVLVHIPNLNQLPSRKTYKRRHDQLWMFYTHESPRFSYCLRSYGQISYLDDWFNLTCTIKTDHWYFPYDLDQLHTYQVYFDEFNRYLESEDSSVPWEKKKLAMWFVSNCDTPDRRENLVRELDKYITIDKFGSCKFKNNWRDPCKNRSCYRNLYKSYKFYLSFENSNCDYYITEKYFKLYTTEFIFEADILPVVRGPSLDYYLRIAPDNHSFIFADQFDTAKSLADYLIYLDSNKTAYDEYFEWKRRLSENFMQMRTIRLQDENDLTPQLYRASPFCELCAQLHNSSFNGSVKVSEFYNPARDCHNSIDTSEQVMWNSIRKRYCHAL